jgi:hypothetical protein
MDPSVGILLADAASVQEALHLAGAEGQWFLMDDGVYALPALRDRIDAGAEVTVCATDAAEIATVPGVRMGSQYDHARLVRTAARVVALTGVGVDDHRPARVERSVIVRITRERKLGQALRTAVGYAAGDLRVAVLFEPPVHQRIHEPAPIAARALATLRSLGHPIHAVEAGGYPEAITWDVEIRW